MQRGSYSANELNRNLMGEVVDSFETLLDQLRSCDQGKRYRMLMTKRKQINSFAHLKLVLNEISDEDNFMTIAKMYSDLVVSGHDLLALVQLAPERKRMVLLSRYAAIAMQDTVYHSLLETVKPAEQIIFLKLILDYGTSNAEILCQYIARLALDERAKEVEQYLEVVKGEEIILSLLQLLPEGKRLPLLKRVNHLIKNEDLLDNFLSLFPEEMAQTVKSVLCYITYQPVNRVLQAAKPAENIDMIPAPVSAELNTNDNDHLITMKQSIQSKLDGYLKSKIKLHENRVLEIQQLVKQADSVNDLAVIIHHLLDQVNTGKQNGSFIDASYTTYLNKVPGHRIISSGYRKLLEECARVIEKVERRKDDIDTGWELVIN